MTPEQGGAIIVTVTVVGILAALIGGLYVLSKNNVETTKLMCQNINLTTSCDKGIAETRLYENGCLQTVVCK